MGAMKDIDIILTEAAAAGEAAGRRMTKAIDQLCERYDELPVTDFDLIDEMRAAAADAYDAAVDPPITLREALNLTDDTEPQLVRLVREIHEAVTTLESAPGDIVQLPADEAPEVPTNFGARIIYADGTAEDLDNVDAILVHDKRTGEFPFGFQETEPDEKTGLDATEEPPAHRAGFFRPEDGEFVPFSGEQQPKPFNSWGG